MAATLGVVLNVGNVDKSVELYKLLGLRFRREAFEGVGFAVADIGGATLTIFPNESPWLDADDRAWMRGDLGKGVLVGIETKDVRKIWGKVERSGWEIDQALGAQVGMENMFMIVDPDGYVVSVSEPFRQAKQKPAAKKRKPARAKAGKARRAKRTVRRGRR
ncbi:MAG TPA: VOC family protein [Candidatus Thermoplasmatota archaeon]|nr:VOC family protein [Candidatus Thermoplasmatota archaeon]